MEQRDGIPGRARLLADCAALARGLAPELCTPDAEGGGSCAWYHGFWPYLRLLDYGSSPALHKTFYLDGLAPLASTPSARVLISGAADFAMLEVAREALAAGPHTPQFTVVDRCETPLALCRWFAEQAGFAVETRVADMLTFNPARSDPARSDPGPGDLAEGFDAIVTHSFLSSFPAEARPALARRWFALLRPGGRLLTINRVRGRDAAAAVPFSAQEAKTFVARLLDDLEGYRDQLDCAPAEIAALGEAYLSRKRSFPVRTREELAALFEDAGFTLECFADLEDANPGESRPVGPTLPGGATYVKLIARRKA